MKNPIESIKTLFVASILLINCEFTFSQVDKQGFIKKLQSHYTKKESKFKKKVLNTINESSCENFSSKGLNFLFIPGIEFNHDDNEVTHSNFLDQLNIKTMYLEYAVVYSDYVMSGIVVEHASHKYGYEFICNNNQYYILSKKLSKVLLKLKPDIVFRIYSIANRYFYIKDGSIYVLKRTYDNNSGMESILSINFYEYINSLKYENLKNIKGLKRVKVISY